MSDKILINYLKERVNTWLKRYQRLIVYSSKDENKKARALDLANICYYNYNDYTRALDLANNSKRFKREIYKKKQ